MYKNNVETFSSSCLLVLKPLTMLAIRVIVTLLISQLAVSTAWGHYNKYYLHHFYSTESSEYVSSEESRSSESSENVSNEESTSSESSEPASSEESTSSGENYSDLCPNKDDSLLSDSDVKYTIETIAKKLELENYLQSSHLPGAEDVRDHYLRELEEFQQHIVDRPVHMLHIIEDITETRHKLEPKVYDIMAQIYDSDILLRKYNDYSEQADTLLQKLDKSKMICQINCDYPYVESRFGHDIISKIIKKNNMSCIRLKDLNDYVTKELIKFGQDFDHELYWDIEEKKNIYENKLEDLKINLKEAAVKQFGMTMYDILSLQDDYYHLEKQLRDYNIFSEINSLEENTAQIKLRLVDLKRGVEKYRQYCMNCNSNQRLRRDLQDATELRYDNSYDSSYEDSEENILERSNIIDVLIEEKKNEILEKFENNFNDIFQELDAEFDDHGAIDAYVTEIEWIQHDIDNHIQEEQRARDHLKTRIEQSEIRVVHELLKNSSHLLEVLESAKYFINRYI